MSLIPFDDRDGFIWYDGHLVPWRDTKLHVLSHGLHYASCVFEGERVYNGTVFRLEDHNERLLNSARILGFEVPASMDDLAKATHELIAANNILEGYVRPIAWRGAEQMASRHRRQRSTWRSPPGNGRPISHRRRGSRAFG
jgi:branched-chain amino acid aminotransferase